MSVSQGAYQSSIPFVNVQKIDLFYNAESELVVDIEISNETPEMLTDEPKEFGNFVYLSEDRQRLESLAARPDRLKTLILGSKSPTSKINNYYFSLTRQDFKFKTYDASIPPVAIHNNVYNQIVTLKDTKGGNAMTGLIADAHIEKVHSKVFVGLAGFHAFLAGMYGGPRGHATTTATGAAAYEIGRNIDIGAAKRKATSRQIDNLYLLIVSYRQYKNKCFLGNIVKERIVENGLVPINSNLFKLSETMEPFGAIDSIWPGDVHVGPNALMMAGTYHATGSHPTVHAEPVNNVKVRDLRVLAESQTLNFDNSVPIVRDPYFSPLSLTKQSYGSVSGVFAFDLEKYAIQNTKYGGLIKNRDSLLSCVGVDDIRIFRKVIKMDTQSNELTPGGSLNIDMPDANQFEIIASLGDGVEMIEVAPLNQTVLTIAFMDVGAYNYKKGTLEYKVEVVVQDATRDAIEFIRDELVNRVDETNTAMIATAATDTPNPTFVPLIQQYLAAISFIFGSTPFDTFSLGHWKKNLAALTIGANNSPRDELLVIDTVKTFLNTLSAQLTTGQAASGETFHGYSHITNPTTPGYLSEEYYFRNRYRIINPPFVGMDYLGSGLLMTAGRVPAISYEMFESRANAEVAKYAITNTNVAARNKHAFLSPDSLYLGSFYRRSTQNFYLNQNSDFSALLRNNAVGTIQFDEASETSEADNISDILNAGGVQVRHLQEPLSELLFPDKRKLPIGTPAQASVGSDPDLLFDNSSQEAQISGSNQTIVMFPAWSTGVDTTSPVILNLVNNEVIGHNPVLVLQNPNNIAGSLALAKYYEDPTILDNSNALSNMVNFESLVRVEYLESYHAELGVTAPQWRRLGPDSFQQFTQDASPRLCRLVRMTQILNTDVTLGLQPLGTVFTLGVPGIITKNTNYLNAFAQTIVFVDNEGGALDTTLMNDIDIYYSQNIPMLDGTEAGY